MTEQTHKELQTVYERDIPPINARHVLTNNWVAPTATLVIGAIISVICMLAFPDYSFTYVAVLMPICALIAITQLSLGLINEIDEHDNR